MKLNEGEIHDFQVIKIVDMPDEGHFYLLRHKSGRRLLLPIDPFKNYGIEIGKSIPCRVDKVSCTGKVYLEPLHPFYLEGNEYEFDIIEYHVDEKGAEYYIVNDCYNNPIKVTVHDLSQKPETKTVKLRVEGIKKGVPLLTNAFNQEWNNKLKEFIGKTIRFKVSEISRNSENVEVYRLVSTDGLIAELKVKHYKAYNIIAGKELECEVYGFNHNGILKVEPQNPIYQKGKSYTFDLCLTDSDTGGNYHDLEYYIVDAHGNKCGIELNGNNIPTNKETRLECRVIGFRKGRPKLEFVRYCD